MRFATMLFVGVIISNIALAQQPVRPVTVAEAIKRIDQKVVLQMEVKSTGGNTNRYLNSTSDFKDASNFTIYIPEAAVPKFKTVRIDDPAKYYKGKTILVTGTVVLYKEKPQIQVDEPTQIRVVEGK
jgi:DNA/RNA endonuclease YhcR with UshA esterase domain